MEEHADILDLLSLDSQLRPPRGCKQRRSQTGDLESFVRARIDHITVTLRILKRDTRNLNTTSCRFLIGSKRTFKEEIFNDLVRRSRGQNQWVCCGPDKGQLLRHESESMDNQDGEDQGSASHLDMNEALSHYNDSDSMEVDAASEYHSSDEQPAATSRSAQMNDLQRRYQGFRTEMIERVTKEIDLLKTTLITRVKSVSLSRPARQTRSQANSLENSKEISLDDLVAKSLGRFTTNLISSLDTEFLRRFPELPGRDELFTAATGEPESPVSIPEAQAEVPPASMAIATIPDQGSKSQGCVLTTSELEARATPPFSVVTEHASEKHGNLSDVEHLESTTSDSSTTSQSTPQGSSPDLESPVPTRKRVVKRQATSGRKKRKQSIVPRGSAAELINERCIQRFVTLVRTSRSLNEPLLPADFDNSGSRGQRAAAYWRLAHALGDSSNLYALLSLVAQIEVAEGLDQAAKKLNYARAPRNMIDDVLETLDMGTTQAARSKFQEFLRKPRKLIKVLGSNTGLLSFVSLEEEDQIITLKGLLDVSEKAGELGEFHSFLKASQSAAILAGLGRRFQTCMLSNEEFPDMLLEKINDQVISDLTFDDLVQLASVWHIEENVVVSPTWAKPHGWDGAWPADPTCLLDPKCQICSEFECSCIQTCFEQIPTVVNCGVTGLGLEAAGTHDGEIVYTAGQKISQFVGRVVGPESFNESPFTIDLVRSDMDDAPIVAQICARNEGNVSRFVNHRCREPSARLEGMAISQRYRVVLSAVKDIYHGEEITVNFGRNFRIGESCSCQDCT